MTVIVHIGRRVPRSWYRRLANKAKGLLTFQEHIWQMIETSMKTARRKALAYGGINFVITKDTEIEDLNYQIEWMKIVIQGTPEVEEEEYNDTLKMYDSFSKHFKKELPNDPNLAKHFKTKMINAARINECYEKGYGSIESDNISNKLLEMGIMTDVQWLKDYETRDAYIN